MIFSSTAFLYVFLPLFLCCYALLPQKNLVILCFSLLFFTWGESYYILLLLTSIGVNYWIGKHLHDRAVGLRWLSLGLCFNVALLAYYKYFGFVVTEVLGLAVATDSLPHLPLGISFFTFQSISYLVDVYRGQADRARSFSDLALYISMFPQLIAGPIVRYNTVSRAITQREVGVSDVYQGTLLFICGLAYKVLLANNVAPLADQAFALGNTQLSPTDAWLGALAYSLQIYFDFAGYSLMAIGIGRLLGFHFPQNFNYPYISQSISEFWRRWHMSLSSWFRDYLYIPLGGNRLGPTRTYINLATVFLLCGFWHGAAWTFLAWGAYHGLLLVIERAGVSRALQQFPAPLRLTYTWLMIMIGWVIFRANDLPQAANYLATMFGLTDGAGSAMQLSVNHEALLFLFAGILFSLLRLNIFKAWMLSHAQRGPFATAGVLGCAAALGAFCTMYVLSGTYNPFIYFRF